VSRYSFSMPPHAGRQGWFRIGEVEITTTAITVALGVASMFVYAIDKATLAKGAFLGELVREGEVWRIFTWPLVNPPDSFWVVITLAFFWFVGHRVEDEVGRVRFLVMMLAATIVPALIVTAIPLTSLTGFAYGLGIPAFGLLVVIAVRSPSEAWFFGIPVWVLTAVYAAIEVLRLTGDRLWGVLLLEALVVVTLCVAAAVYGVIDALPFIPRVGAPSPAGVGPGRSSRPKRRRGKKGADGNVTPGPWAGSSAGPTPLESAELDVLLDKIGQDGIKSLSKEERRRLDELSKKMRGG
jgi:membrane associated rhomboid family serine protease